MKADFSRWTAPNARRRHYSGVLMQQGRPHTDADWNEQVQIQLDRSEAALGDLIGQTGTPKASAGFRITAGAGGFQIGAGRYYLDGAMVENDADVSYDEQGGSDVAVPLLSAVGGDGTDVIVYLEATRVHVNGLEDERLLDPALQGVDTATRIRAGWRVGIEAVTLSEAERQALVEAAHCGHVPDLPGFAPSTGRMSAETPPAGSLPDDSDCQIPPEAGYLSQENQLYRVEIVTGGTREQARFVWSRENGSVEAALARNPDGDFILQGAIEDEALGFASDDWVEVYDAADVYNGRAGDLRRITLTGNVVQFSDGIGDFNQLVRPRVRRWDHGGDDDTGVALATTSTALERGIEVSFTDGTYRVGDHWVFEARAATGHIVWPQYPVDDPTAPIPPMGWGFRRAPLALAQIAGDGLSEVVDLRARFPTLTCLHAEDVEFDDSRCNLEADTVQEALEALCHRTSSGLCSVVARTAAELVTAVAALSPGQSARICLQAGHFALEHAVLFDGLGHIVIQGAGPQTVLSVRESEPALAFRRCASVRVTDLSVNGGPTGTRGLLLQDGRLGAVTAVNCGDASFERLRVKCRAGLDRSTACISTDNRGRHAQVLIRDCTLKVGQAQIGVQVIDAQRAVIENNVITPVAIQGDLVRRRVVADPVLVARMRRAVLGFASPRRDAGRVQVLGPAGEARTHIALDALYPHKATLSLPVRGGRDITAHVEPALGRRLLNALSANRRDHVSTGAERRQHVINLLSEAIRDPGGRATIAGRRTRILADGQLTVREASYLAQGIVVAGSAVQEAHVLGNRIAGANDGVRVAASTASDLQPPTWLNEEPANRVRRARIEGNTISLAPIAAELPVHGIYLGHVSHASIVHNDVDGLPALTGSGLPHFGFFQYGARGPRLTIADNSAVDLHNGFAVLPSLDDSQSGIWRLRDNAAAGCQQPYVVADGVEVR